jgi:hypothetical protein
VLVTYVTEDSSPFGYEYVEFDVQKAKVFDTRLRLEGTPGAISTSAYLPVVEIRSGPDAFRSWLAATIEARARRASA